MLALLSWPGRGKQRIATWSVIASSGLAALKFAVELLTGSLGLIAEAAHSLLDLVSTLITLLVVRVAAIPPDRDHPYGHEKAENLGALAGMALLAATAAFILYHAIIKIFVHPAAPDVTFWSFGILIISIGVDLSSARALRKAAKKQYSDALASDAEHFWNDLLGAMAVLARLAIVAVSRAYDRPIHSNVIPKPSVCSYDTRTARVLIASCNEVGSRHEREQGKNFHCFARSVIFSVRDT